MHAINNAVHPKVRLPYGISKKLDFFDAPTLKTLVFFNLKLSFVRGGPCG